MNKTQNFEEKLAYNKLSFFKITNKEAVDFLLRDKIGKDKLEILLLNKFNEKFDSVFVETVIKKAKKFNISEERTISSFNKNNKLLILKKCIYAQFEMLTSKVINTLKDKELIMIDDNYIEEKENINEFILKNSKIKSLNIEQGNLVDEIFHCLFNRSINLSDWLSNISNGKRINFIKILKACFIIKN